LLSPISSIVNVASFAFFGEDPPFNVFPLLGIPSIRGVRLTPGG
jgi:hypothetical protein